MDRVTQEANWTPRLPLVLALPLTGCVTLGLAPPHSGPWLPYLQKAGVGLD